MNKINLTKKIFSSSRADFRKEIITEFLNEKPGTGKGALTSRYDYNVKILQDGREVYLRRPASLNNGLDFTLNVSDVNFNKGLLNDKGKIKRASTRPTHDNILTDLKNKKTENNILYSSLVKQVDLIFKCQQPTQVNFAFTTGHSTELILECIKWLFVEQDVTYWNYSGRSMFNNAIKGI